MKQTLWTEKFAKIVVTFLLNCALREQSRKWIGENIELVLSKLAGFKRVYEWLVEGFTLPQTAKELMLENPAIPMRKFIVVIL